MTTNNEIVCVGGIVVDNDRILLIRRKHNPEAGKWSVPGGRLIEGESHQKGVEREVLEETGLTVTCKDFVGETTIIRDEFNYRVFDYLATPDDTSTQLQSGDDATDARWIAVKDLHDHELVNGLVEFLTAHKVV